MISEWEDYQIHLGKVTLKLNTLLRPAGQVYVAFTWLSQTVDMGQFYEFFHFISINVV